MKFEYATLEGSDEKPKRARNKSSSSSKNIVKGMIILDKDFKFRVKVGDNILNLTDKSKSCKGCTIMYSMQRLERNKPIRFEMIEPASTHMKGRYIPFIPGVGVNGIIIDNKFKITKVIFKDGVDKDERDNFIKNINNIDRNDY